MSYRAVILGLTGALVIAGFGYLNDSVMRLNFLVGNHFPISVFGLLVLLVLIANPLLGAFGSTRPLRGAELAAIVGLALAACGVPGSSMMRTFTPSLAMPVQYYQTNPGWQARGVMDYFPPQMLPNGGRYDSTVIDGYVHGLRVSANRPWISPVADVPWSAWETPLATWSILIALVALGTVCLALLVHRQWSRHERLRYPVAVFAETLLQSPTRGRWPDVIRSRAFWLAVGAIAVIRTVNGVHAWYPESVEIPLEFPEFGVIVQEWEFIRLAPGWHKFPLFKPQLFPMVIAFAYFLASDVSLSLGLSTFVFVIWTALAAEAGADLSGTPMLGGPGPWFRAGSYLGLGLLMLYVGRRYYTRALAAGLTGRAGRETPPYAVWAVRGLIAAVLLLAGYLWLGLGLDPTIALLTIALLGLMYVCIARMNAEGGLIFVQAYWQPPAVLIGLFGYEALGPGNLAIVALLTAVLVYDPREILLPFLVNGLRICDRQGLPPRKTGPAFLGVYLAGFALAVPVVLWANYNFGINPKDSFATRAVPQEAPKAVDRAVGELTNADRLESSAAMSPVERLLALRPDKRFLGFFGAGAAAVVVFSVLRLRLPWWPLHPILFLTGGTWAMDCFGHSFLLGWAVKATITRAANRPTYEAIKRFMIGVICAEAVAGLTFMVIGGIDYAIRGSSAVSYMVLPP